MTVGEKEDLKSRGLLRVVGLNHFTVPVGDRYKAARFYVTVLGGEVDHESDPERVKKGLATALQVGVSVCSGFVIDLFEQPYGQPANEQLHPHYAFDVPGEDLNRWVDHLNKWGVPYVGPMTRAGTGAGEIYFDDPYGNHLELYARNYRNHDKLAIGPYDPRLTLYKESWPPRELEEEANRLLEASLEHMRARQK
jgi:catechol-2,3-dioxygenase